MPPTRRTPIQHFGRRSRLSPKVQRNNFLLLSSPLTTQLAPLRRSPRCERMTENHPLPPLACTTQEFLQIGERQSHSKGFRKPAVEGAALLRFAAPTHYGRLSDAVGCMALMRVIVASASRSIEF